MKEILKHLRGSVWWIELDRVEASSMQGGKRPCVIISNDINNMYSPVVQIVTLTTAVKNLCVHADLGNILGKGDTYAQAEQIKTVDKSQLFGFTGILSTELLNKIMEAVEIQLGLKAAPGKLSEQLEQMFMGNTSSSSGDPEEIKDNLTEPKNTYHTEEAKKEPYNSDSESQPSKFIKKEYTEPSLSAPITAHLKDKYKGMSALDKFNARYNNQDNNTEVSKKSRMVWTDDAKREFLNFYKTSGVEATVKKYNLSSKNSANQYAYKFRRDLGCE